METTHVYTDFPKDQLCLDQRGKKEIQKQCSHWYNSNSIMATIWVYIYIYIYI